MFLPTVLRRTAWRYLLRHPWQTVLLVMGIMLGVAVVIAIDIANTSASKAFEISTDMIAGKTSHQIVGPPQGLPSTVYTNLRLQGVVNSESVPAAPVVSGYVQVPVLNGQTLQLLGVDPFAEPPFRNYLGDAGRSNAALPSLLPFLTAPNAALLSGEVAAQAQLAPGDFFDIHFNGQTHRLLLAGVLTTTDSFSAQALADLMLVDIATAQELTGQGDTLSRIDLILNTPAQVKAVTDALPSDARLLPVSTRTETATQMVDAFRINLSALSLLGLLVGMFLIYNTMTFAVVQRRPFFGTLRCLGVTRHEIFLLVLNEALVLGILGASFGLVLGMLLGRGAIQLVSQTINDLFFAVNVRSTTLPWWSLLKGAGLGLLTTLLAATLPALEATSIPPRTALVRSGLEDRVQQSVGQLSWAGLVMLSVGLVLLLTSKNLGLNFVGIFVAVIGAALLVPLITVAYTYLVNPVTTALFGVLGKLAPRNIRTTLSRTAIAIASLMVAVAVTVGVQVMVGSFRQTVVDWLTRSLQGDIYISAPGGVATQATVPIDPQILPKLQAQPGIQSLSWARTVMLDSDVGTINVIAGSDSAIDDNRLLLQANGDITAVWADMQAGGVAVTEPFANRTGRKLGDTIILYTPQGARTLPIVAVYYDYTTPQGRVALPATLYQQLYADTAITAIALQLTPGQDPAQTALTLRAALAGSQQLVIRANQTLRAEAIAVFDRTFAITAAMQLIATLVAFIGVLSALLALALEKQRELGLLRALGLTVRQIWQLILLETGLLGVIAGVLAMPTGLLLAVVLIYIINQRSFGWSVRLSLYPEPFLQALVVAVVAALLAGIYPAYKIGRMAAAEALRFD